MPRKVTVLKVFVASPNDVADERDKLAEVIQELNKSIDPNKGIQLELVRWETDVHPDAGTDPQGVINAQIGDDYDIFVGILSKRFGTPTPRAESGTDEEFRNANNKYKKNPGSVKVMVYFKNEQARLDEIDLEQLSKVREFKESLGEKGVLWWQFDTAEQFAQFVRIHLHGVVNEWNKSWGDDVASKETLNEALIVEESIPSEGKDDDEGFFDLLERAEESSSQVIVVIQNMLEALEELTQKINAHTERMEKAQSGKAQLSTKDNKKFINDAASEMENYTEVMKTLVPQYSKNYQEWLNAMVECVNIYADLDEIDIEELKDLHGTVTEMRKGLKSGRQNFSDLTDSVEGLPKLTTRLNRAKRRMTVELRSFDRELETSVSLVFEVEKAILKALDEYEES